MNTNLQVIDLSLPLGSIDVYYQRVNQFPMLSAERERELATRLIEHNDLEAARELVLAHLRYVVRVARGYAGYGLPEADLIQEGNVGLMKAVRRFDPTVGVRLVSFAVHWIKAEIHEFIIKNWRIVKIATTKAQRKLFFNLRSARKRLGWMTQREMTEIAKDLGVKKKDVMEMEKRLNMQDAALEGDDDRDGGNGDKQLIPAPITYLAAEHADPAHHLEIAHETVLGTHNLYNALAQLDERSQVIIKKRWLSTPKATLHELAAEYKISAERVRQLETAAISKLKAAIEKNTN